jgi:23S rRNA (pseudouridine1915-N3)-methyltransferase
VRIIVLAVGKIKEPALAEMCDHYLKLIGRHCPIEVKELKNDAALRKALIAGDTLVALEVNGATYTSTAFAKQVQTWVEGGASRLVFLIGGADGLPADVSKAAQRQLSLSTMTLPHRVARVILLEQVYRAFSIWRGEPYARED